jgi:hypothetical protein
VKKLWTGKVSLDFEMAVYAESEEEALRAARKGAQEEIMNHYAYDSLVTVSPYAPPSFLDGTLPWGDFEGEPERDVATLKAELGVDSPTRMLLERVRGVTARRGP